MYSKITLFIAILLGSLAAQAQNSGGQLGFTGDTTAYINELVVQKSQYLNKSVNSLLTSLKLPIYHYVPSTIDGNKPAINVKSVGILFYTDSQESVLIKQAKRIPIGILVFFSPTVPKTRVDSVLKKHPWLSNAGLSELFGQCLVTDIITIK